MQKHNKDKTMNKYLQNLLRILTVHLLVGYMLFVSSCGKDNSGPGPNPEPEPTPVKEKYTQNINTIDGVQAFDTYVVGNPDHPSYAMNATGNIAIDSTGLTILGEHHNLSRNKSNVTTNWGSHGVTVHNGARVVIDNATYNNIGRVPLKPNQLGEMVNATSVTDSTQINQGTPVYRPRTEVVVRNESDFGAMAATAIAANESGTYTEFRIESGVSIRVTNGNVALVKQVAETLTITGGGTFQAGADGVVINGAVLAKILSRIKQGEYIPLFVVNDGRDELINAIRAVQMNDFHVRADRITDKNLLPYVVPAVADLGNTELNSDVLVKMASGHKYNTVINGNIKITNVGDELFNFIGSVTVPKTGDANARIHFANDPIFKSFNSAKLTKLNEGAGTNRSMEMVQVSFERANPGFVETHVPAVHENTWFIDPNHIDPIARGANYPTWEIVGGAKPHVTLRFSKADKKYVAAPGDTSYDGLKYIDWEIYNWLSTALGFSKGMGKSNKILDATLFVPSNQVVSLYSELNRIRWMNGILDYMARITWLLDNRTPASLKFENPTFLHNSFKWVESYNQYLAPTEDDKKYVYRPWEELGLGKMETLYSTLAMNNQNPKGLTFVLRSNQIASVNDTPVVSVGTIVGQFLPNS